MKQRTKIILEELKRLYPDAKCELNYETPFQLLVATILSAQTTDKKVNEVTESLFRDYPDVDAFLTLSIVDIQFKRVVFPTPFGPTIQILSPRFISKSTFSKSSLLVSP